MLSLSSLSQIPFSPLPLPISFSPPSLYVSLSFTFLLPVQPAMIQRDSFSHPVSANEIYTSAMHFSISLLFFFFSCFIFHFFFLCLQPLPVASLVFCMTGTCLLPSPWGTWEQMTTLAVNVLPQIPPRGDSVSPQSRTEMLRRLVDRNWRMLLPDPVQEQCPAQTWKKSWGCVDSSIPGSGRAPCAGQC